MTEHCIALLRVALFLEVLALRFGREETASNVDDGDVHMPGFSRLVMANLDTIKTEARWRRRVTTILGSITAPSLRHMDLRYFNRRGASTSQFVEVELNKLLRFVRRSDAHLEHLRLDRIRNWNGSLNR